MVKRRNFSELTMYRELARCAVWRPADSQVDGHFDAQGMSLVTSASNSLRISPDFDVLAWLIQLWLTTRPEDGILRPRIYDIALALYGGTSGGAYEMIGDSLARLGYTRVALDLGDKKRDPFHADGSLISYVKPVKTKDGREPTVIALAAGITDAILNKERVRYPLSILRSFHGRQALAKRIWIYLEAERFTPVAGEHSEILEENYITLHDKAFATFGMNYKEHRFAQRAIASSCTTILSKDERYLGAGACLRIETVNGQKRLYARRVRKKYWLKNEDAIRTEIAARRAEIRGARATKRTSEPKPSSGKPAAPAATGGHAPPEQDAPELIAT